MVDYDQIQILPGNPLGVCTWTFGDLPLPQIASRLAELNYDGVELLASFDRYSAAEARQILTDAGLQIFSLTPANVDIAHPDPDIRQAGLDYYLQLLDFAADLGNPLISCHGFVGRVRPLATLAEEKELLVTAVRHIAQAATQRGQTVVFEVLNRYETHLINTAVEAAALLDEVQAENVGILLDAYHMNIEEQDPAAAIALAGERLGLFHIADSNRQAIGRGHTKFGAILWALEEINYRGPFIMECTAPGPDPFSPIKDEASLNWLEVYLRECRSWF